MLIILLSTTNHQKLSYLFFIILEIVYINRSSHYVKEPEVTFKSYEQEIRQYLMKKDPSVLYKVDLFFITNPILILLYSIFH